jgi:hypothetical protein
MWVVANLLRTFEPHSDVIIRLGGLSLNLYLTTRFNTKTLKQKTSPKLGIQEVQILLLFELSYFVTSMGWSHKATLALRPFLIY